MVLEGVTPRQAAMIATMTLEGTREVAEAGSVVVALNIGTRAPSEWEN